MNFFLNGFGGFVGKARMAAAVLIGLAAFAIGGEAFAASVSAEPPSFACRYGVYWTGGVHIADLFGSYTGETNEFKALIETYGLVQRISRYRSDSTARYRSNAGSGLSAETFRTRFRQRKVERTIALDFDADGRLLKEAVNPPDNRAKRPAVDDALKPGTSDPLTAAMTAQDKIRRALTTNKGFSFRLYDGRRLSELSFSAPERLPAEMPDEDGAGGSGGAAVIKTMMRRKAIQGYTSRELERIKEEEPVITLYLDEKYLLPVRAEAAAPLGRVTIMREECSKAPHF